MISLSCRPFYINLRETCLCESNPNALWKCRERGGQNGGNISSGVESVWIVITSSRWFKFQTAAMYRSHNFQDDFQDHTLSLQKSKLNQPLPSGHTLVTAAIQEGSLAGLQLLLELGADPDLTSISGKVPISMAIDSCQWQMVDLLLASGASHNIVDGCSEKSLLVTACLNGQLELAKLMLKHSTNLLGSKYVTEGLHGLILGLCRSHGDPDAQKAMVSLLLDHWGDVIDPHLLLNMILHMTDNPDKVRHVVSEFHRKSFPISEFCLLKIIFGPARYCLKSDVAPDECVEIMKLIIGSGTKCNILWKEVLPRVHSIKHSEIILLPLIRAFAFHYSELSLEAKAFHYFVRDGLLRASILLCEAGYTPNKWDCLFMKKKWRAVEGTNAVPALKEIKGYITSFRKRPRTLQNCCIRTIRKSLHDNIIYNVELLNLPARVKQMIMLESGECKVIV